MPTRRTYAAFTPMVTAADPVRGTARGALARHALTAAIADGEDSDGE